MSELLSERLVVGHAEVIEDSQAPTGDVLTLEDAAALLRVSVQALRARAEARELPGRRFGREWRFSRTALLAWLEQGEPDSSTQRTDG